MARVDQFILVFGLGLVIFDNDFWEDFSFCAGFIYGSVLTVVYIVYCFSRPKNTYLFLIILFILLGVD